jgi:hypothetical protein
MTAHENEKKVKYYDSGRYLSSFYLKKQRFGDWILSPSSGKPYLVGPNPYS